jgi:hypothetical protein
MVGGRSGEESGAQHGKRRQDNENDGKDRERYREREKHSLCLGSDIDDVGVWLVVAVEQPVDGRFDSAAVGTPHLTGGRVDARVKDDGGLLSGECWRGGEPFLGGGQEHHDSGEQ